MSSSPEIPPSEQTFRFHVDESAANERLDKFLSCRLGHVSRNRIKVAIDAGGVRVNGTAVKPSHRLRRGDAVEFRWIRLEAPAESLPENIPLSIVYEDEALAVIEKPAGMVMHVGAGVSSGTLVNALQYHLNTLSRATERFRPGLVHRLDKFTSGLLVVAKTDAAHAALAAQFHARTVEKRYIALVHGRLSRRAGEIALPVARDRTHRTKMTAKRGRGREALTRYRVTREFENYSLLEVEIKTGRTHQIRVHFSALGHPVVGDRTYGAPEKIWRPGCAAPQPTLGRNFLHAAHLSFDHPVHGKRLTFHSALPEELADFLAALTETSRAPAASN